MSLRIGDTAPDFDAETQDGKFNFYKYIEGSWAILFSHPKDFTPVCATELGRVAQLKDEWAKRNVKTIGLSVDTPENHAAWIKDINDISNTTIEYPIVGDSDRKVSELYGMLSQDHLDAKGLPLTVRSVFVLNPSKIVKLIITYPASTGRSFSEILRVIDSLQLTAYHQLATPADWTPGKDAVVVPSLSTEEATKVFPKGVTEVRKWLRTTPDPTNSVPIVYYFSVKARGLIMQVLSAFTGQKMLYIEDAKNKSKGVFGQLPHMVDGDVQISQSNAIARYLAKKWGVDGRDNDADFAVSEMMVEESVDIFNAVVKATLRSKDKEADYKVLTSETLPKHFTNIEKVLGDGDYFGSRALLGDLAIFTSLNLILDLDSSLLDNFSKLKAFYGRIASNSGVAALLKQDFNCIIKKP